MEAGKLFAKRTTLETDGMPWLNGNTEYPYAARRNPSTTCRISASLVRGLMSCLQGWIKNAYRTTTGFWFTAQSKSDAAREVHCEWSQSGSIISLGYPLGDQEKAFLPYHVGQLAVIAAVLGNCQDFIDAYNDLVDAFQEHGLVEAIAPQLVHASDELYYFLKHGESGTVADRFNNITCRKMDLSIPSISEEMDIQFLTQGVTTSTEVLTTPPALSFGDFIGWQAEAIREALEAGENILLAGPTGTGKTMSVQQVIQGSEATLVSIEGKDGLLDIDFLGAFLPQPDGSRRWIDGPILRAMRMAKTGPVVIFLDEINRIQRHQTNLLIGLMNKKSHAVCEKMRLETYPGNEYYVLEVPMTSETVFCPTGHLRFIGAGNFGRAYAVYDLDPALRRRFDTVVEYNYLQGEQELVLLKKEVPEVDERVAGALVALATETRRMMDNGDLPGCVDTSTLINWARKCARSGARTLGEVLQCASLTWADQVCGRNHLGLVNKGSLEGLGDYLRALKLLPDRDASRPHPHCPERDKVVVEDLDATTGRY